MTTDARWQNAKSVLQSHISGGGQAADLLFTFTGTSSAVPVFGTENKLGNYCTLSFDRTIAEIASIEAQLTTLVTSLADQAVKKMMGTGSFAQFLSSIIYSLDMIIIAFLGSAIFGFILLVLYAWKPFITVLAYTMVFSVMIVLLVGAGIVNAIYWDNMKSM